jgi:hypothetical protein
MQIRTRGGEKMKKKSVKERGKKGNKNKEKILARFKQMEKRKGKKKKEGKWGVGSKKRKEINIG